MAYTTIDDPSAHFQTKLYTGTGSSLALTNDGNSDLQPDWVWAKRYSTGGNYSHAVFDSTRGSNKRFYWPGTAQNDTNAQYITSFDTNGFTMGTDANINENNLGYVAWQWKANGGTTVTNTDGNITSSVQANPDAGFSIVTYAGNGVQTGKTVGHGLNSAPKMIISKNTNNNSNVLDWRSYHVSTGATKYMTWATTQTVNTYNDWDNTAPTASVYSVGGAGGYTPTNTNNCDYLAYVFAEVQGYSKFGSYTGNYSTVAANSSHEYTSPYNGPFIYCGFKPAMVIIKRTDSVNSWIIFDNTRGTTESQGNVINYYLKGDSANPHGSHLYYTGIDTLSNGFKIRGYDGTINGYGNYIYMAFAEDPFVTSTGLPTTAR